MKYWITTLKNQGALKSFQEEIHKLRQSRVSAMIGSKDTVEIYRCQGAIQELDAIANTIKNELSLTEDQDAIAYRQQHGTSIQPSA